MLGINLKTIHEVDGVANRQAQIDQAEAEDGLTFLAHPYDHRRGWYDGQLIAWLTGFSGVEIHNGISDPELGRDLPAKIDSALSFGHEFSVIATDDFHRDAEETMDLGYVVINSDKDRITITTTDVIAALQSGNFFACGRTDTSYPESPRFTDISVDGHTITVKTDKRVDIEFISDRRNYAKGDPKYIQKTFGKTSAEYTAQPGDHWVRITAIFTTFEGTSYAWSNPIFLREGSEIGK